MGGVAIGVVCLFLCPAVAVAQSEVAANNSRGWNSLPDAPSASVPVNAVQVNTRSRAQQSQSWWLVAPADAPYEPLSSHEKFHSFVHHAYSPYTIAGAMYDASWAQAWGDPRAFGGGMEGWSKRMGAAMAGTETRSFFGAYLFPVLLHQDPRYFAMYKGPVIKRGLHAISRVFVTRSDDGSNTFNSSGFLTIAFTESLGMAWTPEGKRSATACFTRMLGALQGDATSYVLREFTPDILRLFKRHAPTGLRRIEEKMPTQITGDTMRP